MSGAPENASDSEGDDSASPFSEDHYDTSDGEDNTEQKANGDVKKRKSDRMNGFDNLDNSNAFSYSVEVAMLEIYNETVWCDNVPC